MSQAATLQVGPSSTDLASERTRMAAERNLNRLDTNGLADDQPWLHNFQFLEAMQQDSQKVALRPHGLRNLGLT